MVKKSRWSIFSMAMILVMLVSAFPLGAVMAQDEAPPPEDSPPAETAPVEGAPVEVVLPETIVIVPLDEAGEPISLAEEQAATVLATGDPIYCPGTSLPGSLGCSDMLTSIAEALAFAQATTDTEGTIYVAADYDDQADTFINGSGFSVPFTLFMIGGVGNMDTGEVTGRTLLSYFLAASNLEGFSMSNFELDRDSGDTMHILDINDVTLENVVAHSNNGIGIAMNNIAYATINDSSSSNNGMDGLQVSNTNNLSIDSMDLTGNGQPSLISAGFVSLHDVTASGTLNGGGMVVSADSDVYVDSSSFNNNAGNGLEVNSGGNVFMSCSEANSNTGGGAVLQAGEGGDVMVWCSQFTDNTGKGMDPITQGDIFLASNTVSGNDDDTLPVEQEFVSCSKVCPTCKGSGSGSGGEEEKPVEGNTQVVIVKVGEGDGTAEIKAGYSTVFKLYEEKEDKERLVQLTVLTSGSAPDGSSAVYTPLDESKLPAPLSEGTSLIPWGFNLAITNPDGSAVESLIGYMLVRFYLPEGFVLPGGMRLVIQYFDPATSSWTPMSTAVGGGMAYTFASKPGTYALTMEPIK